MGGAGALRLVAFGLAVTAAPVSVASGDEEEVRGVPRPMDREYRAALSLVYDGSFGEAEERLAALSLRYPEDPVGSYLQALAVEWRLEQGPPDEALDREVLALADLSLETADARLRRDPTDLRARMARGAAHGVKSRHHLFRREGTSARREALSMRAALLEARDRGARVGDLDFGLGLYDYYADTLPRVFNLIRILAGIPGGDRERGLDAIARAARGGSLFHDEEACVQMFEIQTFFEHHPDGALHWIRRLWQRHPGWPLWGLKLAELLKDLGLYEESSRVSRTILAIAEEKRHPNYQPVVGAMARVILGEARLLDMRPAAAREAALPAIAGVAEAGWVGPRASIVVGRGREREGDRAAALPHYRRAASGKDPATADAAREALSAPLTSRQRKAWQLLARARRLRGEARSTQARAPCLEALRADPSNPEARLCAAEVSLVEGGSSSPGALVRDLVENAEVPPWIRARARLTLARALEREGRPGAALSLYKKVWEEPSGRLALRAEAAKAVTRLDPDATLPIAPRWER
jgi:hypothetical protein